MIAERQSQPTQIWGTA